MNCQSYYDVRRHFYLFLRAMLPFSALLTDSIEFLPDVDSSSGAEEDDNSSTDIVDVNDLEASLYEPEDSSSETPSL